MFTPARSRDRPCFLKQRVRHFLEARQKAYQNSDTVFILTLPIQSDSRRHLPDAGNSPGLTIKGTFRCSGKITSLELGLSYNLYWR